MYGPRVGTDTDSQLRRAELREIGGRIARARMLAGYVSRAALGAEIGSSGVSVGRWEAGVTGPGAIFLARISRACGVSLDWLIRGQGEGPVARTGTD